MKITLLAIGTKMPAWVTQAYTEYASRLTGSVVLELKAIVAEKRGKKASINKLCEIESDKLIRAIPKGDYVIALDVLGKSWSTEQLAEQMENWMMSGRNVTLLVGGPEGMSASCRQRADQLWSLSALTFPHPLVRVVLSEQLYRAWSLTQNHPYHRVGSL
ncbi:MAG: 23S rRNA (pseudouridine(1915)-N(3))-methyltransferase RlmH [Thiotrichaceae bacterium]|nr:23S rRNA (pseudouridine(1915)-N(3))-methyltransferase RlmH [Thiotrichaceae bacterium]